MTDLDGLMARFPLRSQWLTPTGAVRVIIGYPVNHRVLMVEEPDLGAHPWIVTVREAEAWTAEP